MNTIRIRQNGQAEMRDNVRNLLKERGISQRAAAESIGIKPNHLTGFLGGNNWFRRDAAASLAALLEVGLAELVGDSIFATDRDRFPEFDHDTPDVAAWKLERDTALTNLVHHQAEARKGDTRAICCQCGALRLCHANRHRWDPVTPGYFPRDGHRVTEKLHCAACETQTTHAVLVLSDKANDAEAMDQAPSRHQIACAELDKVVARVTGFNVEVVFASGSYHERSDRFYPGSYDYNTATGRWRIEVDPAAPPQVQTELLRSMWERIATDDHGDSVTWDPRDGIAITPRDHHWTAATDDLMADLDRYLHVARRQMVAKLQDELEERQ